MKIDRRDLLKTSSLLAAGAFVPSSAVALADPPSRTLPPFYDDIERRTFRWLWDSLTEIT